MNRDLPAWVDVGLIPLINLALAFFVSGLVVLSIGEDPIRAVQILVTGALGSDYGIGYTLFYTTTFIFTGLAVAVAFHASLFNIGGEGQAGIGGLGVAAVCLALDWTHWAIVMPLAIIGGGLFGAAWAAIPAYLQARRGSHIVITTIMFNFIGAALLVYLLVNVLKAEGSMAAETRKFATHVPFMHEVVGWFGGTMPETPMNLSFFWALICSFFVWLLIWRMRLGYQIRAFGFQEAASIYAGMSPFRLTMITMIISGALAGQMGMNVVMGGYSQKLVLDAVLGAGFVGIAVALMGRSHPVGVVLAALLFGVLYQGGAELAFEMPAISRDMIVVIQALVILFTGALENMVRGPIEALFNRAGR